MLFEVFDRLSKLQNLILGEVSGFYSLIFYPTAFLTVYLLTSTSRTASARFWLFVIFICSLGFERLVVSITISDSSSLPGDMASVFSIQLFYFMQLFLIRFVFVYVLQEEIHCRVWIIRRITILLCVFLLGYTAYKFQDYNIINNQLLLEIQRQNLEFKGTLETYG